MSNKYEMYDQNGALITTTASGVAVAAADVTYTPTTGADWVDPDPTEVEAALDDLAARLTDIDGAVRYHFVSSSFRDSGKVERVLFSTAYVEGIATAGAVQQLRSIYHIPPDFSAIDSVSLVCIFDSTNAATYNIHTFYGAAGEALNTHTGSSTPESTSASAADRITLVDISSLVTSLAAGDYLLVNLTSSGSGNAVNLILLGILLGHT